MGGMYGVVMIIITFPYSTCISTFFVAAASRFLCSFLKCFFVLVYVIFVKYSKRCSKNIRDCSKALNVCRPPARESRDFHVRGTGDVLIKLQLSLCAIMAS